jgi:uncharacterized membrane protein YadS
VNNSVETSSPSSSEPDPCPPPQRLRWWRNEDWLAVVIGGIVVCAVLLGFRPSVPGLKWAAPSDLPSVLSLKNLTATGILAALLLVLSLPAIVLLGGRAGRFAAGFVLVFGLAWLSQLVAGQSHVRGLGLEYVLFALGFGLLLNHLIPLPAWVREAVRTEFFIKTGLVILGSGILFKQLLQAGALGLVQAALVVAVVWYVAFWIARRFRVDDELGVMLSSAVAICGVSAAIATCGAIQGDRKKLSYVTSLVLIVAVPMMVLMPWIVRSAGMPDVVAGAWLGGTLDTSGSVVAAGNLISESAMKAGVIVKFSQNVLIGVAAFALSIWWAMRSQGNDPNAERVTARVIWDRFPKFVLGFMAVSLVFSFLLAPETASAAKPALDGFRNFWFAMAFVSIGLETHFGDLVKMEGGRPALAFTLAQAFNVIWTLLLAWLLFGGVLFAAPDVT